MVRCADHRLKQRVLFRSAEPSSRVRCADHWVYGYTARMPSYRRYFVAGGTYFFTLKTERNAPIFRQESNVRLLGVVIREMKQKSPLTIDAIVLLPDHLHTI